jgi:asparagine synthase (glutamine-hydrolysing)
VILDGHGGDEVVGYGSLRVIDMARKGQWFRMLPLLHTHSKLSGDDGLATWLDLYKTYGPQTKLARIIRKIVNRLVTGRQPAPMERGPAWRRVLSEAFQTRTDLTARYRRLAVMPPEARDDELAFNRWPVLSDMMQSSFEALDKASAVAGVEARYPFFDTRLVAFSIGLPASEKLRFGQTRSILRRALKGVLPDKVRLRQTKTSFHPEIISGLLKHHADLLDEIERNPHDILAPYVNSAALHELIGRLKTSHADFGGGDAMFLWRLCSFYIWRRSMPASER